MRIGGSTHVVGRRGSEIVAFCQLDAFFPALDRASRTARGRAMHRPRRIWAVAGFLPSCRIRNDRLPPEGHDESRG